MQDTYLFAGAKAVWLSWASLSDVVRKQLMILDNEQ